MTTAEALTAAVAVLAGGALGRISTWPGQRRLRHLALHDPLTGLNNQAGLADAAHRALPHRGHSHAALLVVHLHTLTTINDEHGHPIGDAVLREAARRLHSSTASAGAIAARLASDELAVLIPRIYGNHLDDRLRWIAQAVHRELTAPYLIPTAQPATDQRTHADQLLTLSVAASIGAAYAPKHRPDLGQLLTTAAAAMHAARRARGGYARRITGRLHDRGTPDGLSPLDGAGRD